MRFRLALGGSAPLRREPSLAGRRRLLAAAAVVLAAIVFVIVAGTRADGPPAVPAGTPTHVPTWAYDDGCNGGAGAKPALVRSWVTYAEANCGVTNDKARVDCHPGGRSACRVMQYLDTGYEFPGQPPAVAAAAAPDWWLHSPAPHAGSRISSPGSGAHGYLINQGLAAVRRFFAAFVRRHFDADQGLLMDWQSPSLAQELYYSNCSCSATSEIRSDAALRADHTAMSAALRHRNGQPFAQVDNSLPATPALPQGLGMLDHRIGVDGWVAEGEPVDHGTLDANYSTLLDQIAYVATRTRGFVVPMSRARVGAPYLGQARRVQEATMLLGFSPGHLVDWANLEVGSRDLAVWPEEGIYPERPVQSMRAPGGPGCLAGTGVVCSTGGHNDLQVAPGVYRRVFRSCSDRGRPVGGCGVILNTTDAPVTVTGAWVSGVPLTHQITFTGGDVQSGGSLRLAWSRFRPGVTTVAPRDAVLMSR